MIIFLLFLVNAASDLRRGEILLSFTVGILLAGVCRQLVPYLSGQEIRPVPAGTGLLSALVPGIVLLLFSLASAGGIGAGDGLSVLAAGFWTSAEPLICTCLAALVMVPAAAGLSLLIGRPRKEWPFMPFLFTAWLLCGWPALRTAL